MKKAAKKPVGRKCSICTHKQVGQINKAIAEGVSFRRISSQFGMSDQSAKRHTENCLKLELQAAIAEKKVEQAIDVHKEFEENLDFARQLRIAAREYLSDPNDPLKMAILPRAEEIDVVYFDYNDMTGGENPMPKKKTAKLAVLIQKVEDVRNFEADKFTIKHYDLRKFALDAISTTDACIDKFAKLAGLYVDKDKPPLTVNVNTRVILPPPPEQNELMEPITVTAKQIAA
jgi:hypothetical protein